MFVLRRKIIIAPSFKSVLVGMSKLIALGFLCYLPFFPYWRCFLPCYWRCYDFLYFYKDSYSKIEIIQNKILSTIKMQWHHGFNFYRLRDHECWRDSFEVLSSSVVMVWISLVLRISNFRCRFIFDCHSLTFALIIRVV